MEELRSMNSRYLSRAFFMRSSTCKQIQGHDKGERRMYRLILGLYKNAGRLLKPDEAQNLTEYALCFTMIALGTVAGMSAIATSVGHTFAAITTTLSSALY